MIYYKTQCFSSKKENGKQQQTTTQQKNMHKQKQLLANPSVFNTSVFKKLLKNI